MQKCRNLESYGTSASTRGFEPPTPRLGVKITYFLESSKFSVVHIFHVIWTFLWVVFHQIHFFPSNIVLFLPVQLAGY